MNFLILYVYKKKYYQTLTHIHTPLFIFTISKTTVFQKTNFLNFFSYWLRVKTRLNRSKVTHE